MGCAFCSIAEDDVRFDNGHAVAIRHASAVTPLHIIVAPRTHVASIFRAGAAEQQGLWAAVNSIAERIGREIGIRAFSIGFVEGAPDNHLHIEIIPRHQGDGVVLPSGVEWVKDELCADRRFVHRTQSTSAILHAAMSFST